MSNTLLFSPTRVGPFQLEHRVALAPLTRRRGDENHVPSPLAKVYYEQRASTPGTLLITEATFIAPRAGGYDCVPGIWSEAQVRAWKEITDAVHAKGSFIFCQIWAIGRTAYRPQLPREFDVVSSGDIPLEEGTKPRPLTVEEIDHYVELYAEAAQNAVRAGFDGVEIHNANGYLLDQFVQSTANNRTDEYGGSIENRIRFPLRVARAVADAIGPERVGIRLSPYERFQGMFMPLDDLHSTFSTFIERLAELDLAYLHLIEPRVSGQLESSMDRALALPENPEWEARNASGQPETLDWATEIWSKTGRPVILAGGYTPQKAEKRVADGKKRGEDVIIAFGRHFISNPDLPDRIRRNVEFTPYIRLTFYTGSTPSEGYTDYPFASDSKIAL